MKITLFILSRDKDKFLNSIKARHPKAEIDYLIASELKEKSLSQIINKLRETSCDCFIICCDDLEAQRYLLAIELITLFAKTKWRLIIDRKGKRIKQSRLNVSVKILRFFLECTIGLIIVGLTCVNLFLLYYIKYINLKFSSKQEKLIQESNPPKERKIAFLRTTPAFSVKVGGSVTHIAGFTTGIWDMGYELIFISNDKMSGIDEKKTPIYIIPPIRWGIVPEWQEVIYNYKYIHKSKKILKKEEPCFLYQRYSAFNCSGMILSRLLKIPLILEFNSSEVWKGKYWKEWRFLWLLKLFEKTNLLYADLIIVVSESLKKELINIGIASDKIVVNPNGVNPKDFQPGINAQEIRKRYRLRDKIVVGFTGSFSFWHGIPTLSDAIKYVIAKNKNIHFLLIGDGPLSPMIIEKVNEQGMGDYVTFTGIIAHGDVPKYLSTCDILVSPHNPQVDGREFFGSPTKLFEYMAMEKGIVASKLGQIGEVLKHNHNAILVEPGNVNQLAEGILKLAGDKELREKLGRRAREDVIENYTWKKNAERVIKAVREL